MLLSGMPAKDGFGYRYPVNNSLWDLYNLLKFIRSDSEFADVGVFDMRAT